MDFDFNDFAPVQDAVGFTLINPGNGADLTRGGKPVRVFLFGPDHQTMVDFDTASQERRLTQAGRVGKLQISASDLDDEATKRCARAIAGWENFALGGTELPYSDEAALQLVRDYRWLRDFVEAKLRDRGNFLGTAASSPKK